jgi:DNA-directed RNA polymerase subunit F
MAKTKLANFRTTEEWREYAREFARLSGTDLSKLIHELVNEKIRRTIARNPELRDKLPEPPFAKAA